MERNPLLRVWMDLNAQALAYWRDLGLTPSALRRITGESGKAKEADSPLTAALKELAKE
jgi:phage terminase small subunit